MPVWILPRLYSGNNRNQSGTGLKVVYMYYHLTAKTLNTITVPDPRRKPGLKTFASSFSFIIVIFKFSSPTSSASPPSPTHLSVPTSYPTPTYAKHGRARSARRLGRQPSFPATTSPTPTCLGKRHRPSRRADSQPAPEARARRQWRSGWKGRLPRMHA